MAATIKQECDIEPELIEGSGGIFDVKIDDQLIYCKLEEGRFPAHDEIVDLIKENGG